MTGWRGIKKQEQEKSLTLIFLAVLRHGLRMDYVPDHLHPRPCLACLYGHHPRYLGIVVRSPPKGSTYANRILPRYAYVTQSLRISLYDLFFRIIMSRIYELSDRSRQSKSNISIHTQTFISISIIINKI